MRKCILGLAASAFVLCGCAKEQPKANVGTPDGKVDVDAPGVKVKAGKGGAQVTAPGVEVKTKKDN